MFKLIITILSVILLSAAPSEPVRAEGYQKIETKEAGRIPLPAGYHEGILKEDGKIWVCNGEAGKIWIIDEASSSVVGRIEPIGNFTEAVTNGPDGLYFTTEWDEKKLYLAKLEDGRLLPVKEISLSPAHPAGCVWTGERLYLLTWTRGLGTKFDLLELDGDMNILNKTRIKDIQDPTQLAWDGKNLWISSWFYKRVHKVDAETLEIKGWFDSPVDKTTGILWDGRYMWLTGTYSDLYKLEIADTQSMEADMEIKVTGVFKDGGMIPAKYTCDGEEVSPPIEWGPMPQGTHSIALISDDPDVPMGVWVHWVIFNIPPDSKALAEGVSHDEVLADGSIQGRNTGGDIGYGGPCPPSGTHRYYFKVYALDKKLDLKAGVSKQELLKAMEGHILDQGELMGRYSRK